MGVVVAGIKMHVWGDFACFTRPEMKVERVSYDVMTPSAARGILEAIHWKPAISWTIDRIHVLKPIRFQTFRRNEVGSKIPAGTARTAMNRNTLDGLGLAIDDKRQQRATIALREVAYVIEAHLDMTDKANGDDTPTKHLEMFTRRAAKGQCFHRPCLGCREFVADFELIEGALPSHSLPPDQANRELGWMLYDIDFKNDKRAMFFRAQLKNGVLDLTGARPEGFAS
jgi:CRISPR-associated protein Cas5d